MPHPHRRAPIIALIALHATLSLGGAGHHAPSDRAEGPRASRDPAVPEVSASPSAGHCPICDHLAQGQLPAARASIRLDEVASPPAPDRPPAAAARPARLAAHPRAPPRS